jgi:hypothetical protein
VKELENTSVRSGFGKTNGSDAMGNEGDYRLDQEAGKQKNCHHPLFNSRQYLRVVLTQ